MARFILCIALNKQTNKNPKRYVCINSHIVVYALVDHIMTLNAVSQSTTHNRLHRYIGRVPRKPFTLS